MSTIAAATPTMAETMAAVAAAGATSYWCCYQCSRFIRVRAREVIVCPDCGTSFVELVESPRWPSSFATTGGEPTRPQRRFTTPPVHVIAGSAAPAVPSRPNHHRLVAALRSRRTANGGRPPFDPVIVLRRGGGASHPGRGGGGGATSPAVEIYYDGGSGARPLPAIMSDFIMGSAFNRLLEQLADMEASEAVRRESGHLPASKAAVESMPTVRITQDHIFVDAHCGVCQEPFDLGTETREMPCKHVYHEDCILPWLSLRNSCPVCRHEMPVEVRGGRGDMGSNGGEEDAMGLTIWSLPGGGFAVGRFPGGRRSGGREVPVVHTVVDGYSGVRSGEGGAIGRMFRRFLSFFACLSSSPSPLPSTSSASGSSSSSTPRGLAG